MQMYQAKVANNQARPAATTSGKIITQPEKGLRHMQENRAKKPQTGKRQTHGHAKLTTGRQQLSVGTTAPST